MKTRAVLILLFLCPVFNDVLGAVRFKVLYSEPLAVYEFVRELASGRPDNEFRRAFEASGYNREPYTGSLRRWDSLQLYYAYSYDEFPQGQKVPGLTTALLKHNLIACNSVAEFKARSIGIVPNDALFGLCDLLTLFQPVYREVIYVPHEEDFNRQLQRLEARILSDTIQDAFNRALIFYNSSWDVSVPFEIALYPSLSPGGFSAEAFINNGVCQVPLKARNDAILLAVLTHEVFHLLYDQQSLAFKKQLAAWFEAESAVSARYAFLLINEALATAVGNGYVYEKLSGETDGGEWYHQKYINDMAQRSYPLVRQYLEEGKAIDRAFVTAYVKVYDEAWLREWDNLFTYRSLVGDDPADFDYFDWTYPYRSMSEYQYPLSVSALERLSANTGTKVVVVSSEHGENLARIAEIFQLPGLAQRDPEQEFVESVLLPDRTWLLLINRHEKTVEELMKNYRPGD